MAAKGFCSTCWLVLRQTSCSVYLAAWHLKNRGADMSWWELVCPRFIKQLLRSVLVMNLQAELFWIFQLFNWEINLIVTHSLESQSVNLSSAVSLLLKKSCSHITLAKLFLCLCAWSCFLWNLSLSFSLFHLGAISRTCASIPWRSFSPVSYSLQTVGNVAGEQFSSLSPTLGPQRAWQCGTCLGLHRQPSGLSFP